MLYSANMIQQYAPFIFASVLSAATSAAVTVILIRYLIIGKYITSSENKQKKLELVDSSPQEQAEIKTESKIRSVFEDDYNLKSYKKKVFKNSNFIRNIKSFLLTDTVFLKKFLVNVLTGTLRAVDVFLKTFFEYITLIFEPILKILYDIVFILETTKIEKLFKLNSNFMNGFINNIKISINKIFLNMNNKIKSISYKKNYNAIKNIEEKNTSPKEQAVENTLSVPLFEDEKNSAIKVESIFDELLFSIIPLVLVALPFLLNIHKYSSNAIFFYLSFIVGLGAYMLLKLASPRSFWAIGISVWSALTYLSFVNKTDSLFFPATAFLCFFLTVYALASYFWYGHKERSYATLEYAFYIIHPVLYIAAIYLLVYSKSAYIVGLIDIAIAALYANFAITIKNRDGNRLFVDVSFIVSFIATISAMLVISNSLFQSIILFSIYAFIFSNRAKISQWYLLPILMLTFFKALDSTNYGVKFLPIFNIRFITYLLAAAVFLHAYIATKEGVIHFHNFSRNIKRLSALSFTILLFLGGTLEIADVKRNTEFMPGLLGTGALLAFYLSVAAILYFYGKKHNERTVLGLSIILAIYSLYFLLNYLV